MRLRVVVSRLADSDLAQSRHLPIHSVRRHSACCRRSFLVRPFDAFYLLACLVPMQRRAWLGCGAYVRRSALRADFPAMLGPAAPPQNSLRSLRSLRSNTCGESVHDSRCARGRGPCASRRLSCAPQPSQARLCSTHGCVPRLRADMVLGLRQSGGPRSEVKEETWAQPRSGDMSGGGHPADVAKGQRKHAEGSEKNSRNRREPNVRNGPIAAPWGSHPVACVLPARCLPLAAENVQESYDRSSDRSDLGVRPGAAIAVGGRPDEIEVCLHEFLPPGQLAGRGCPHRPLASAAISPIRVPILGTRWSRS